MQSKLIEKYVLKNGEFGKMDKIHYKGKNIYTIQDSESIIQEDLLVSNCILGNVQF